MYVCKHVVFEVHPTRSIDLSLLEFFVWALKSPRVFSSNLKWGDTLPMHFLFLSKYLQPLRSVWKTVTLHHQTCLRVHSFRWTTFWAFVVNCDLIDNKNSTVIKLGTCAVNVLCQLWTNYYVKYRLLNVMFQLNSKTTHCWSCLHKGFSFVVMWRTHSRRFSKNFGYTL
jgi:hypothetical protein